MVSEEMEQGTAQGSDSVPSTLPHSSHRAKQAGMWEHPFSQMGTKRSEPLCSCSLRIILNCTAPDLSLGLGLRLGPGSRRAPKKGKGGQTRDNLHGVSHTGKKL